MKYLYNRSPFEQNWSPARVANFDWRLRVHSRHGIFICIFSGFLLLVSLFATAQSAAPAAQGPDNAAIIKDADDVSIALVVHQKHNKPVSDLKPEDLQITDEGTPVTLSDLKLVSGDSTGIHRVTFLFDQLDPSGATNARDVAKKILKIIPTETFSFSVFSVGGRLKLLQGFTENRQTIQDAINIATGDSGSVRDQTAAASEKTLVAGLQSLSGQPDDPNGNGNAERAELASLREFQRIGQEENTTAALASLLALSRTQAQIPARKLLVYFTAGLHDDADTNDMLRSIAGAAARANVSIFVINKTAVSSKVMEGLMAAQAMGAVSAFNRMNPGPSGPSAQIAGVFSGGMISETNEQISKTEGEGLSGDKDPAAVMATSTGGAYLFSEDNLKKPFRQAVADLTNYYEASYVPPKREYDGTFHRVAVKPLRHGLKLRARAGYFAVPPASGMRPYELALMKVFSSPHLPGDLQFRSAVLRLGELPTGNENTLAVEVPIASLETQSDANTNLLSWHVLIVSEIKDKSGAIVAHFSEDIPGHGALSTKDQVELGSTTMQRHFPLSAGDYTLETVVVDRISGKVGAQRSTFEVSAPGSGPSLSDLALVGSIDPYPSELDPLEPLRYEHGRVVPRLSASIARGSKDLSFFFLVHPDSSGASPALLEMEVLRNGELLGQIPLQLPKDLHEAFPYVASLKAASLPAGNYEVRLSLSQDGGVSERETSFRIPGSELASATLGKMNPGHPGEPTASLADSGLESDLAPPRRPELVITTLPRDSVIRPSQEELDKLIAGARNYAINYATKLPNFVCVEITDRAVDSSGKGRWKRKDSFAESLQFVNNHEIRKTLEFNGQPSSRERSDMNGPISLGEFGDLLSTVFKPASKTEFHWKETVAVAHRRAQVFEYKVNRENNSMLLGDNDRRVYVGFHGLVYIDSETMGVRRITMEADNLPTDFSIHAASVAVDYEYVPVGSHEYSMPIRGTIRVQRGKHEADLNQVVFQDYRRYASAVKINVTP